MAPDAPHGLAASEDAAPEHPFAPYVRTLGRGPGKSRALTREEARAAMDMMLRGAAEPVQVGAFLMLLRYRGEDTDELAGLAESARAAIGASPGAIPVDLDWPSYGAGKTRGAPWYLLAALALAEAGHCVVMHGSNAFSQGITAAEALAALGRAPSRSRAEAEDSVAAGNFAYLPLAALSAELDRLLSLRALLGLRSPVNTIARMLNPFDAPAGVDGVFHPPYIAAHLGTAEKLGRPRLLVLKGGGGEAERNPAKPATVHLLADGARREVVLPALAAAPARPSDLEAFRHAWRTRPATGHGATVIATIALGLLAMGEAGDLDRLAEAIWRD